MLLLSQILLAAPQLAMFDRFPSSDSGPDTRGAIWYNNENHQIFVADHGKGLWKIDECGNDYGQTTTKDNGIWDIRHSRDYIFAVGKSGLFIYDENGNYLNSLNGIQGEGIYVKGDYAYIVNEKDGITIVNIENINKPFIVDTVMKGEKFSQIRGGTIKQKVPSINTEISIDLLYITSLDGRLYLFERQGSQIYYKDDITLFSDAEARKIFAGKKELVYINSNFGELAVIKVDKNKLKLHKIGAWKSSEGHGKGQQSPAAGGVFVKEIKDGENKKTYALITAADGNSDGYLYWLDVTDPENIQKVDTLHDTEENYGFNDIWVNDTRIYLASHNGFAFMALEGTRNTPLISILQDDNTTYLQDGNATQEAKEVGDTRTFYIRTQNSSDDQKLKARLNAPESNNAWEYHYYYDNSEITEKITSNKGYIAELAPGETIQIKVEATPQNETASDTIITVTAANKEAKSVCGKPLEHHSVNAIVKFPGAVKQECKLSFPGAVSSTKDLITLGNKVTIKGNGDALLTTMALKTGAVTTCDGKQCQKSNTLAQKFSFALLTGDGKDGTLKKKGKMTIEKDKNYQKIYMGTNSVLTIQNAVIKVQKEFQLNSASTLNIKGNVTIHADKFQLNQKGTIYIEGTLKIIANEFYINANTKINSNKPQNFIVLAKKIININNAGKVNGIFYSNGDLKLDNANSFHGALTAAYIDINNYTTVDYSSEAIESFCTPASANIQGSYFNVWDRDESIEHQVIKTKIEISIPFIQWKK